MALDILIKYKDPDREAYCRPFSFQDVLRESWWPLAEKLGLPLLQRLERLCITERSQAVQLADELRAVRRHLSDSGQSDVSRQNADYMLLRIDQALPAIELAIAEWEHVNELVL